MCRQFLLGSAYLNMGEEEKALDLFLSAAGGVPQDTFLTEDLLNLTDGASGEPKSQNRISDTSSCSLKQLNMYLLLRIWIDVAETDIGSKPGAFYIQHSVQQSTCIQLYSVLAQPIRYIAEAGGYI